VSDTGSPEPLVCTYILLSNINFEIEGAYSKTKHKEKQMVML